MEVLSIKCSDNAKTMTDMHTHVHNPIYNKVSHSCLGYLTDIIHYNLHVSDLTGFLDKAVISSKTNSKQYKSLKIVI